MGLKFQVSHFTFYDTPEGNYLDDDGGDHGGGEDEEEEEDSGGDGGDGDGSVFIVH